MIGNSEPLLRALIEACLLLESCGSDEIDPDTAVRGLENIAGSLLKLADADQLALRAELERIARTSDDQSYRGFVASLSDMIGLASPPDAADRHRS